jgi:hypothetical protein
MIGDLPPELLNVLQSKFRLEPDIEVVGHERGIFQILARIADTHADIVMIMLPDSGIEPGSVSHILGEYPAIAVVAVTSAMDRMAVFWNTITRKDFAPLPSGNIGGTIRDTVAALER